MGLFTRRDNVEDIVIDAACGLAGGVLASWVMGLVMNAMSKPEKKKAQPRQSTTTTRTQPRQPEQIQQASEPNPTETVAKAVTKPLGVHLNRRQAKKGGQIVHYAYGGLWGAVFGVLAPRLPLPPVATGGLLGTGLWLISDEVLVPLLRLSNAPWKYPVSVHGKALAAHAVYGVVTDAASRGLSAATHVVIH